MDIQQNSKHSKNKNSALTKFFDKENLVKLIVKWQKLYSM